MTFLKVLINGNSFFLESDPTIHDNYFCVFWQVGIVRDSKRPRIFFCLCDFLCQRTISVGLNYAQSLGLF